jgi:CubicO group peptidase (beta-lactamase class C family)
MKTNPHVFKVITLCICLLISATSFAQSLTQQIDSFIGSQYTSDIPGVSILVAKDGKAVYSKGFGSANLESGLKANPDHVFEIGSITKQFTAVAILMLEEQGKLSVDDTITKFIPEYPTQGKTITVHHLLNHTSGIKSYTNMESFMTLARTDMTPIALIDKFKNEPMEFDPGTAFNYNNSGYVLLGHIIEVASGQSYEDFIQANIFDKVGMSKSYYGSMTKLIPNRARGYSETETGYRNANYLSLTLPYAAGSIMSTTGDLLKWQNAISANTLIKRSSLDKAINGSTLTTGEDITYGYGFIKGDLNGSATVEHSGGIFGYSSHGIYLPEENVYVIGLTNCDCGNVGAIVSNVAAMTIGKPYAKTEDAIALSDAQLSKWVGAYAFDAGVVRHITLKDNQLYSQREGSTNLEIYPMTATNFIFDGGATTYDFSTENGNRMATMTANGTAMTGTEIDKAPPAEREELTLDTALLQTYIGSYELQPGFNLVISVRDNTLYGVATGQGELELFAEAKDKFFLKAIVANIDFTRNAEGAVDSLTLFQGGQVMLAKKID